MVTRFHSRTCKLPHEMDLNYKKKRSNKRGLNWNLLKNLLFLSPPAVGCAPFPQVLKVIHLGFFDKGEKAGSTFKNTDYRKRKKIKSVFYWRFWGWQHLFPGDQVSLSSDWEGHVELNNFFISSEITIGWHLDTGKIFWNTDALQKTFWVDTFPT